MFGDNVVFSLYVTVIGLVIVFVVLIILMALTQLVKYVNLLPTRAEIKKKRQEKKQARLEASDKVVLEESPAPAEIPQAVTQKLDPDELYAVISAAVAAYMAEEPAASPNGIVVRSVRRSQSYNTASRYERANNRI